MKITRTSVIQHAILYALFSVGFFAFIFLAGDDDPMNPLPLSEWFAIKLCAAAVIGLCVLLGKYLSRKGLLPEIDDPEN